MNNEEIKIEDDNIEDSNIEFKVESVEPIEILRNQISINAGAVDSRQGKAWDLQEVILLMIMDVFTKINTAKNIEEIKSSTSQYMPLFIDIQKGLSKGEIQMVHKTKGLDGTQVINEVIKSMNDISSIFKSSK